MWLAAGPLGQSGSNQIRHSTSTWRVLCVYNKSDHFAFDFRNSHRLTWWQSCQCLHLQFNRNKNDRCHVTYGFHLSVLSLFSALVGLAVGKHKPQNYHFIFDNVQSPLTHNIHPLSTNTTIPLPSLIHPHPRIVPFETRVSMHGRPYPCIIFYAQTYKWTRMVYSFIFVRCEFL